MYSSQLDLTGSVCFFTIFDPSGEVANRPGAAITALTWHPRQGGAEFDVPFILGRSQSCRQDISLRHLWRRLWAF